jgi:hypothetical protein
VQVSNLNLHRGYPAFLIPAKLRLLLINSNNLRREQNIYLLK